MARMPSTFPYRRKSWVNKIWEGWPPHSDRTIADVWLPDTHMHLWDAMELEGKAKILNWNGQELTSRSLSNPPDRPWLWNLPKGTSDGYFVFTEDNEVLRVDENKAEAWWKEIEPRLLDEWRQEREAHDRWQVCVNKFRNWLVKGEINSAVVTHFGLISAIPREDWMTSLADSLFERAHHEFHIGIAGGVGLASGPIIVPRKEIDEVLSQESEVGRTRHSVDSQKLNRFPYLQYMLKAASSELFASEARVPKKAIEDWLKKNWPRTLGRPSPNKLEDMAKFLRRPEDEQGGLHSKKRST